MGINGGAVTKKAYTKSHKRVSLLNPTVGRKTLQGGERDTPSRLTKLTDKKRSERAPREIGENEGRAPERRGIAGVDENAGRRVELLPVPEEKRAVMEDCMPGAKGRRKRGTGFRLDGRVKGKMGFIGQGTGLGV